MTRHAAPLCALTFAAALTGASPAAAQSATQEFAAPSAYGCAHLENDNLTPILEGKEGVFYRVYADIRLQHPFSDRAVTLMGQLADNLAQRGTTLIYLPIPTKSQAMPDQLPDVAKLYGFRVDEADRVYRSLIDRLEAQGVTTADAQSALRNAETAPFFGTDFHWNAEGARLVAETVAKTLQAHPDYADLDKTSYITTETGTTRAFSGLRRQIQKRCLTEIPQAETMTYETVQQQTTVSLGAADLFGSDEARTQVVITGTSFADMEIANFDGWLSQYSELEVFNYAITGGNQFGAMLSYVTSDDFRADPPHFLIWENPIYNNLLQYGEQPMLELIAAASDTCGPAFDVAHDGGTGLSIDLTDTVRRGDDVIHAAAGTEGPRSATFTAHFADGTSRTNYLTRNSRLRATGHFYMPLEVFGTQTIERLDVTFDRPVPASATLNLCRPLKESL